MFAFAVPASFLPSCHAVLTILPSCHEVLTILPSCHEVLNILHSCHEVLTILPSCHEVFTFCTLLFKRSSAPDERFCTVLDQTSVTAPSYGCPSAIGRLGFPLYNSVVVLSRFPTCRLPVTELAGWVAFPGTVLSVSSSRLQMAGVKVMSAMRFHHPPSRTSQRSCSRRTRKPSKSRNRQR
ncbi:hypothetical protein BaRGS_00013912 [Batillaria attramentaria]|uniref:Secreted protein n=1 Tax=Batillaria attramentaria TaxID=370345 RepID=A0ABD0L6L5_9CAEN